MSFIYPRTISIFRPGVPATLGVNPYSSAQPSSETVVATGIAASIQLKKEISTPDAKLPDDASKKTYWNILFKGANGLVMDRDIIIDDLNIRYQVTGAYWNSLGYQCICERLEA